MKRSKSSPTTAQRLAAHRKVERRASLVSKKAEAAHHEYRQAKVAYKAAKKAARAAKVLWHRLRVSAREAQRAVDKSAKRMARPKAEGPAVK